VAALVAEVAAFVADVAAFVADVAAAVAEAADAVAELVADAFGESQVTPLKNLTSLAVEL
jgi:hypothetical protein